MTFVSSYAELARVYYRILRSKGFTHEQIAILNRDLSDVQLTELKAGHDGPGEIKVERGDD